MKRIITAVLVVVFAVSFTIGILVSNAEARPQCIATCLNGSWYICCPDGQGGWYCYTGGPCDWPGWIP